MSALLPCSILKGMETYISVHRTVFKITACRQKKAVSSLKLISDQTLIGHTEMEQSLLGFYAANPTWQPTDPTASMFLSRLATEHRSSQNENLSHNSSVPASNVHHTSADLTGPPGSVHPSTHLNFTPANSVLAQRSQLYNDAFERSILLASKPSNTLPLQGSTVRKGQRSTARGNGLQAVEEDGNDTLTEASDPLDSTSLSTYQDIHPAHVPTSDPFKRPFQPKEDVDLKGLLQHIGGRRW